MSLTPEWITIAAFAVGGGFGKLADAVVDREWVAARWLGVLFNLIACGTLGLLASVDPWAAAIVLGIFLGVLVSGKVDSWIHVFGALLFCTVAISSVMQMEVQKHLTVTGVVLAASFVDEYVHEAVQPTLMPSWLVSLLQHRVGLDVAVLGLFLLGGLPFRYCLAMWAFDAAYIATALCVSRTAPAVAPDVMQQMSNSATDSSVRG